MVPARLYPRRSVTHLVVHQSDREDISLTYGGVRAWHVTPAKKIGSFFRVLVCEHRRAAELLYPRAKPYVRPASCCLLHEAMYPPARSTSVVLQLPALECRMVWRAPTTVLLLLLSSRARLLTACCCSRCMSPRHCLLACARPGRYTNVQVIPMVLRSLLFHEREPVGNIGTLKKAQERTPQSKPR